MQKLMLHCGANEVDIGQVAATQTPPPVETHFPIPHVQLVEQVYDALAERNMNVVQSVHSLGADGMRYFGMMQVECEAQDYDMVIGLRNSHDKTFAAGLVLGAGVFVCDNLSFSGEIRLARSHTRFIERDLPGVVSLGIGKLGERKIQQDRRLAAYKTTELAPTQADHLMVQMVRERIVMPGDIGKVVKEWDAPRHPEFAAEGPTAWRLFNATTEILKKSFNSLPKRTQALHGLMDAQCHVIEGELAEAA